MSPVEKLLFANLAENPADWELRLELAEKCLERQAGDEAAQLIDQAQGIPVSESQLQRALACSQGYSQGENFYRILHSYLDENPTSATAHRAIAGMSLGIGEVEKARQMYQSAVQLNPQWTDPNFERALANPPEPRPFPELEQPELVPDPVEKKQPPREVAAPVPPKRPEPAAKIEVVPPAEKKAPVDIAAPVPAKETPEVIEPVPAAKPQPEVVPAAAKKDPPPVNEIIDPVPPKQEELKPETDVEPEPLEEKVEEAVSETVSEPEPEQTPEPELESTEDRSGELRKKEGVADAPVLKKAAKKEKPVAAEADGDAPSLITGEGEAVKGAEVSDSKKETISALTTAVIVHIVLAILLAVFVVTQPPPLPPQLTTRTFSSEEERELTQSKTKKYRTEPLASSNGQQMDISTSVAASRLALPELTETDAKFEQLGLSGDIGASMSFGRKGGGMVSFFGSRSDAQKVVFVVDVSTSMNRMGKLGKTKFELMKEELSRSVENLPANVAYQIIFFSGPAWFAGQTPDSKNWFEKDGRGFWHYKQDIDSELPSQPLVRASPSRIRNTLQNIDEVRMTYGTDWRSPLKMAMNLSPDVIYFMTDGAVSQDPDKTPVVEDVLAYNQARSRAKINCVCLMELKAFEMMDQLARGSKGEMSVVLEDGKVIRGRDVEDLAK